MTILRMTEQSEVEVYVWLIFLPIMPYKGQDNYLYIKIYQIPEKK